MFAGEYVVAGLAVVFGSVWDKSLVSAFGKESKFYCLYLGLRGLRSWNILASCCAKEEMLSDNKSVQSIVFALRSNATKRIDCKSYPYSTKCYQVCIQEWLIV